MIRKTNIDEIKKYISQYDLEEIFSTNFLTSLELHQYDVGEEILTADENPEYFYICVEGKAKISPLSEEGKEVLIAYIEPTSLLGDIEFIANCRNLHTVRAVTPVTLLGAGIGGTKNVFINLQL